MQGHGIWKFLFQGLDTPLTKLETIFDHGAKSGEEIATEDKLCDTYEESTPMESEEVTYVTTASNTGKKKKVLEFDATTSWGVIQYSSRLTVVFHVP